jgi:hypothetical protein
MNPRIKEDIINIIKETLTVLKGEEKLELIEISNHTIHNASVFQDEDSISIAVVIYAISKIIDRNKQSPMAGWHGIYQNIIKHLEDGLDFIKMDKIKEYREVMQDLIIKLGEADDKLKLYIDDVLDKAKITKGTKLYEHGVSVGRAAELMGISQWELLSYIGKTQIIDTFEENVIPIRNRIKFAKKLFNIQ